MRAMSQGGITPPRAANFFAQLISIRSIKNGLPPFYSRLARVCGLALLPALSLASQPLRAEPLASPQVGASRQVATSPQVGTGAQAGAGLQPLSEFLRAGAERSFDSREAVLLAAQRNQELLSAYAKLAPVLSVSSSYTRNQYQIEVNIPSFAGGMASASTTTAVITPQDQVDAVFSLSVPLVDAGSWQRIGAARSTAQAARERAGATGLDVQKSVARTYFQYVAACALVTAAERSRDAASENEQTVSKRRQAGLASDLDVARASADTERARQSIADAELTRDLAGRSLQTLTGLVPGGAAMALGDALQEEAALSSWQVKSLPQIRAAEAEVRAAQQSARATLLGYVPTLSGTLSERLTNAAGFGQGAAWSAALSLSFRADVATWYNARALQAAGAAAQVRSERTRRDAEDQIYNAWSQVRAYLVRSRAARSQRESAQLAASLSHKRYGAGTATQLEVIQAERDAFSAEVARIQADADLAYARVLLRLCAGQSPDGSPQPSVAPPREPGGAS